MPIPAGSRYVAMSSSFAAGPAFRRASPGARAAPAGRRATTRTSSPATSGSTCTTSPFPCHDQRPPGPVRSRPGCATRRRNAGNQPGHHHRGRQRRRFLPRLTLASLPWPLRALPPVKARVESLGQTRATDQRFEQLERNLAAIAARLRDRAPVCRVVVVDYLRSCPGTAQPSETGGRRYRRLDIRRGLGRVRRSPCLVGGAVDAALPPVAARGSAVPLECGMASGRRALAAEGPSPEVPR